MITFNFYILLFTLGMITALAINIYNVYKGVKYLCERFNIDKNYIQDTTLRTFYITIVILVYLTIMIILNLI